MYSSDDLNPYIQITAGHSTCNAARSQHVHRLPRGAATHGDVCWSRPASGNFSALLLLLRAVSWFGALLLNGNVDLVQSTSTSNQYQ
ncbi:unnamed protein product [Merluccius merluccius]